MGKEEYTIVIKRLHPQDTVGVSEARNVEQILNEYYFITVNHQGAPVDLHYSEIIKNLEGVIEKSMRKEGELPSRIELSYQIDPGNPEDDIPF